MIQRCVERKAYSECLSGLERIKPRIKMGLLIYCVLRFLRN